MAGDKPVRILGLDELDEDELRETVPPSDIEFTSSSVSSGAHPEPMTIVATVLLTTAALKGLTAWLLKKRHRKRIQLTVETVDDRGKPKRVTVEIDVSESVADAEIVRQVGESLHVDTAVLQEALASLPAR
jgi:hypothetical protein